MDLVDSAILILPNYNTDTGIDVTIRIKHVCAVLERLYLIC